MDHQDKVSYFFFALIGVYLLVPYLGNLVSTTFSLILKIVVVGGLLIWKRKWLPLRFRFDLLSVIAGIVIAILWVVLDPFYPHLGSGTIAAYSVLDIILRLSISIVLASIVEEFFTRYFLHRLLEKKNWLKAPLGTYSFIPFLVTTLFFGFSHNRWLVGLLTGVILNLLWYKKKDMNSIVLAHAVANAVLGIYVIYTGNYSFWF